MPKFQIDEVYPKNGVYPLMITFQNGYATDDFRSQPCVLMKIENTGKKCVATDLCDLVYAGNEEDEDLGQTVLLARNKKTGKVRLIEVGIASLKPVIKVDNEASQLLETSNLELSRKFGSKKQRQQVEHKEKLKINIETVTEQMNNATENITEDQLDLSAYNKNDSDDFYIPPIDRTADTAEDVYDISKILTEEQFENIYSELDGKDYMEDMPPYLKSIVTGRELTQKQTVLAVYASSLLKLYVTLMKEIVKKTYLACPYSDTLNSVVVNSFLLIANDRRTRPTPYKDKAICYAIVFVLLINNYKFELEAFCKDAQLTVTNGSMKVRVTGATVVSSGKKMVQLKLPLNVKSGFRRRSAKV